jgi:hypothetical protein
MSESYDFEVVKDNQIVAAKRRVRLPRLHAAWPIVAELAAVHVKGCLIRVRNVRGEIEILIGVAAARRTFAAKPHALLAGFFAVGAMVDGLPV